MNCYDVCVSIYIERESYPVGCSCYKITYSVLDTPHTPCIYSCDRLRSSCIERNAMIHACSRSLDSYYLCLTAYKFWRHSELHAFFLKPMATLLHHNTYGATALAVHTLLLLSFPTHFINHRLSALLLTNMHA